MNFIEAAVTLLSKSDRPMSAEELAKLAQDKQLLTRPGKAPLRSMKSGLTRESKKDEPRVTSEEGLWRLTASNGQAAPADSDGLDLEPLEPGEAVAEYRDHLTDDEDRELVPAITSDTRRGRRRRRRRSDPESRSSAKSQDSSSGKSQDSSSGKSSDRSSGKSSDRSSGKSHDRSSGKSHDRSSNGSSDKSSRRAPSQSQAVQQDVKEKPAGLEAPGNRVSDAAMYTLAETRIENSVQVKQLAQMMAKRRLFAGKPLSDWPYLKGCLIADERDCEAKGMPPRIEYAGRDLFSVASSAAPDELAAIQAIRDMDESNKAWLLEKIKTTGTRGFELICHVYLSSRGFSAIEWVKHTEHTGYALATPWGSSRPMLVSAWTGPGSEVPRQGVGELRVGVDKKNCLSGLLLSPWPMSERALDELGNAGKSVSFVVGMELVSSLISANIGVRTRYAPLRYRDGSFFDEIQESISRKKSK